MRPLTPRTIFFFSSSSSRSFFLPGETCQSRVRISHFSTSPNPSSSSYSSRRHDEESRDVRVSVWWDFENCSVPAGVNVFRVSHSITAAIRANGIKGPIQITAFGDVVQLSRSNQEAMSSTGINLSHIPNGGKNSADRSLLVDLMYWVSQNPPPAHLFLISGDRDFASILHRLRMNNYNILLASPETAPGVLCSAATIMWPWSALVRGEGLAGRHFNRPPDGPYGSWYGHYKVPLEDPFSVIEQSTCSRAKDFSDSGSDSKPRPAPKTLVKQIRQILNSYPKGISITELRIELGRSNVEIDKDFYGHKKFSRFLLSMPHVLKLRNGGDGQFFVCAIAPKVPEPFESSPDRSTGHVTSNGDQEFTITPKLTGEDSSIAGAAVGESLLPASIELNVKEPPTKVQEPPPSAKKVTKAHVTEGHVPPVEEQDSASDVGVFQRIRKKWFGGYDGGSEKKSYSIPGKSFTSGDSFEKTKSEEKCVEPTGKCPVPVVPTSYTSSSNEAVVDDKATRNSEAYGDKPSAIPGFFNQIINWCKFWSISTNPDNSSEECSKKLNQMNSHSEKHDLFSRNSFWKDMESFMDTPKGSALISQSRTREQMAQNLQKDLPLILKSLSESDLLHLVDLLISEKKWVEEFHSQTSPFKLNRPAGKSSCLGHPRGSNGLRSIFLGTALQSDFQRQAEHDGEKRYQNIPHTGVSPPVLNKKTFGKSKSEILADCQKLVDEILKEHPDGFNMGSFRKLFLDKFGYPLELQMLGYQKLASLFQIMPQVKVESTYIFPSDKLSKDSGAETATPNILENNATGTASNSDGELSAASRKDDDLDSPWEELGPVADTSSNSNEIESGLRRKAKEETVKRIHLDYEPSLSGEDSSDSEEETSSLTGSEGQGKPRISEEDSSLLQILDSWYSSKEDNNRRDGSDNVDGMVDCSRNASEPSGSSGVGVMSETPVVNYGRKQRPPKSYSFVAEPVRDDKDMLIEGILGSLKKSGESKMQG